MVSVGKTHRLAELPSLADALDCPFARPRCFWGEGVITAPSDSASGSIGSIRDLNYEAIHPFPRRIREFLNSLRTSGKQEPIPGR